MIGTSFSEWIFIRLSILCLRYTPLIYSTALLILLISRQSTNAYCPAIWTFSGLLIAEGLFYVLIYLPYQSRLKKAANHPSPLSRRERRELFDRCIANVPSSDLYLQWWFLGADPDEIRRDNIREFFMWAFFERDGEAFLDDEDEEALEHEMDEYISIFQQKVGRKFKDGRGAANSLRLTLDSIHSTYRSLAWYVIIFFIDQATHLAFKWHGFEYYSRPRTSSMRIFPPRPQELVSRRQSPVPQLSYWYRPHSAKGQHPVVFFHGIGIGLWTYVKFLAGINKANMNSNGEIGVIAIEILPISFRLYSQIPTRAELIEQMTAILDYHCWENFTATSHSYGSVLISHLLRSATLQHRIASVALIDPVTIMLHLPYVAYNFTRRQPKRANEWQLWYFASTDPGVALCLGRHFFWRENIIWKDELLSVESAGRRTDRRVLISLSGRDLIVDTGAVAEYLEDGNDLPDRMKVVHFPKLDHAQVFDDPSECNRVIQLIKACCDNRNASR